MGLDPPKRLVKKHGGNFYGHRLVLNRSQTAETKLKNIAFVSDSREVLRVSDSCPSSIWNSSIREFFCRGNDLSEEVLASARKSSMPSITPSLSSHRGASVRNVAMTLTRTRRDIQLACWGHTLQLPKYS